MIKIDELEGFEVFKPYSIPNAYSDEIAISITKSGCRLTKYTRELLKNPDYVLAFFDYKTKRLMIQPGKKGNANIIRLAKAADKSNTIVLRCFLKEMVDMTGIDFDDKKRWKVNGHFVTKAVTPTVVFELRTIKQMLVKKSRLE